MPMLRRRQLLGTRVDAMAIVPGRLESSPDVRGKVTGSRVLSVGGVLGHALVLRIARDADPVRGPT